MSHRPSPSAKGSSQPLSQRIVPSSHHFCQRIRPIVPLSIFLETGSSHHPNIFLKRSSHRPIHMKTNRPISEKRSSHRPIHMDTNRPIYALVGHFATIRIFHGRETADNRILQLFTDFVSRRHHDPVELTSFASVKAISKCRIVCVF